MIPRWLVFNNYNKVSVNCKKVVFWMLEKNEDQNLVWRKKNLHITRLSMHHVWYFIIFLEVNGVLISKIITSRTGCRYSFIFLTSKWVTPTKRYTKGNFYSQKTQLYNCTRFLVDCYCFALFIKASVYTLLGIFLNCWFTYSGGQYGKLHFMHHLAHTEYSINQQPFDQNYTPTYRY